ncbi:hypothetical protein [Microcoleus sp. Pol17_C1]|uniref:hypothetical protein n=1 Tax=unclassified Microcoleus TaxID=2642155 RepID=UPI002FD4F576
MEAASPAPTSTASLTPEAALATLTPPHDPDVVRGRVERRGGIKAIVLARIKVVENFSKTSKSCSGLVT